jgi:hypothetical protein
VVNRGEGALILWVAGVVIFIDQFRLNLSGHATCRSGGARAWNTPLLNRVTSLTGEHRGGVGNLALRLLRIVEVVTIATILSPPMVLSYPPTRIVVGQAPVATRRGCWLTLVSFCSIYDRLPSKGLPRWFSIVGATTMMLPAT